MYFYCIGCSTLSALVPATCHRADFKTQQGQWLCVVTSILLTFTLHARWPVFLWYSSFNYFFVFLTRDEVTCRSREPTRGYSSVYLLSHFCLPFLWRGPGIIVKQVSCFHHIDMMTDKREGSKHSVMLCCISV
jgi:hypothetical protein